MAATDGNRWLVLIHQIPPHPGYLRVKVGRRLQDLGAVPVKNSVYVLPRSEGALEDFQWVRREILAGGGDASVCEARFVEGLSDHAVEALFNAAREAEYAALAREARALQAAAGRRRRRSTPAQAEAALRRLRKRLAEAAEIDFFGAPGREAVEGLLSSIESALRPPLPAPERPAPPAGEVRGRTWVTRRGVHVDRIGSAWLIRRFIDPDARFRFVHGHEEAAPGELRFDMFEADFTHEGDQCTFEVLVRRFALADPALARMAEIVHDIDLKDGRFERPETAGLDHLIAGVAMRHKDDEARLRDGGVAFEALYEYFRRKGVTG
ncbi:MAG TPA: chromate resistance protein ChrB domain-containing protein [Vicinamibacteria bacterium]|jgi:hypothetical protein